MSEPPPTAPSERVIYRDDAEFKKAMDAAAESIARAKGPDYLGHFILWGLIALQAFLFISDWAFGWNVRETLIPGVDLTKPVWLAIGGLVIVFAAWQRGQHGRILRGRLCLQCGTPLGAVPVDDAGDGTCPVCEGAFNLGAYRRPVENQGRGFHGYIDGQHFDKAVYAAGEQIRKARGSGFEADLMGWAWLALGVSFGLSLLLHWDVFEWLPGGPLYYGIWLVVMLVWGGWYTARVKRLNPAIVGERLCLNCGFCLLHTPIGEDGFGRCPECGHEFTLRQYERPAEKPAEEEAKAR